MSKFKALQEKLEKQGLSEESAGAIAYSAGVKKYGKKKMAEASKKHVSAASLATSKKTAHSGSGKR